jgi:hypothetical protein
MDTNPESRPHQNQEISMDERTDIKTVRRRAYLAATEDGLIDIGLGSVFLLFGLVHAIGRPQLGGFCGMPALFIAPLKRFVAAPRVGTARLKRTRGIWILKSVLILFMLAVIGYVVVASRLHSISIDAWTRRYFAPAFGLSLALFPLAGAIALGVRRFYGYAALIFTGFSWLSFQRGSLTAVFLAIGAVVTVTGITVLVRFLREHPVPSHAAGNGGGAGENRHG